MATITNNSQVTITNLGSGGASLNVGGTPTNPLGTGTLTVSNSQVSLVAAPGQATVRIGHDGTGTATFNASTLNVGDGSLIIAGQPGSSGTLTLNAGTVVNTGYVGVGATQAGPGGTGSLIMNNSTINTTTFEIGALGMLSGNGAVINATGDVIVGGIISPGNSPGRININCNLITLPGSRLILDIQSFADGYDIDHLIIGNDSTFSLSSLQIVFNFLGNTDPTAFAASGGFDLDNFIQSLNPLTGAVTRPVDGVRSRAELGQRDRREPHHGPVERLQRHPARAAGRRVLQRGGGPGSRAVDLADDGARPALGHRRGPPRAFAAGPAPHGSRRLMRAVRRAAASPHSAEAAKRMSTCC